MSTTTTTAITTAATTIGAMMDMGALPANHFLSLPRPNTDDALLSTENGAVDTTTLAAHDFDVDNRTGFMPPQPPVSRLPALWTAWEDILQDAQNQRLRLGETPGLPERERIKSKKWRNRVRNVCECCFPS
jgi:indoleamine 2,3-dioxygenase